MKLRTLLALAGFGALSITACKKDDDNNNNGGGGNNGSTDTVYIRGTYSADQNWTKDKVYVLRGYVYFDAPAKLTIQAGTKIISRKDSAGVLVIYKGAQILANGTANEPIVFTSGEVNHNPGDLGGIVLVGNATGNGNHPTLEGGVDAAHSTFGGNNDADNSGVLRYVRVEYGGKAVNPGDEINGISFYGIGSGTTIEYVQVSHGLDDAYEFFGGAVTCKHLIAYDGADDDLDMDDGFHGKIQYAILTRDPAFTDAKGTTGDISNNFEVDNSAGTLPFNITPRTNPTIANVTAIGPNNAPGTSTDYGYGMRWRRGCTFHLGNSIVIGGQKGIMNLRDSTTIRLFLQGASSITNCLLYSPASAPFTVDQGDPSQTLNGTQLAAMLVAAPANNSILAAASAAMLTDPFNVVTPKVAPLTGSPALSGATWNNELSDPFFDKVNYIGALDGSNDWTAGWTSWQ